MDIPREISKKFIFLSAGVLIVIFIIFSAVGKPQWDAVVIFSIVMVYLVSRIGYGISRGNIVVRNGRRGNRIITRKENPSEFWLAIALSFVLVVFALAVFAKLYNLLP